MLSSLPFPTLRGCGKFGKGYSDAEIASVVNNMTGRFGTSASAVTADQVAKRRQEN